MSQTATADESRPGRILRRVRLIGWVALAAFVLAIVVFLVWANTVRTVDRGAADRVFANPAVSVTDTANAVVLAPKSGASGVGLVFVPGARVDPYAYLYKLAATVEGTGLTVVITKPVLNLAILDLRPLDAFTEVAPGVTTWLVGGHSLGGVRACLYADQPQVAGLVLFGSYCAAPLARDDLPVLSLTGSADALSTPAKIADTAGRLPADTRFVEIPGANHARFGDYGVEVGDGIATASTDAVAAAITRNLTAFLADSTSR
ncbi:pimeloyl-ACP methyl ester carboxylesterase [Cryobacterium sp. MP_M5]|uniref:alpha/beta hydrolase n=1 Tax=unclassified Cryobacterium TaxID=2649013 RepID=UPI0018CAAA17|nr:MULTISPECIES: alpha/beta hydrolase [unclassified Cryobacterium]MBG6059729.1 pimeloyl-ACP methyl ester carboxylesterase [Cryobacterium sp. MP_M3]MEC5178101.1 pimeloyl-ACP methyl ester carboxylesterase [Cryobacterium sp. MP_M5]